MILFGCARGSSKSPTDWSAAAAVTERIKRAKCLCSARYPSGQCRSGRTHGQATHARTRYKSSLFFVQQLMAYGRRRVALARLSTDAAAMHITRTPDAGRRVPNAEYNAYNTESKFVGYTERGDMPRESPCTVRPVRTIAGIGLALFI